MLSFLVVLVVKVENDPVAAIILQRMQLPYLVGELEFRRHTANRRLVCRRSRGRESDEKDDGRHHQQPAERPVPAAGGLDLEGRHADANRVLNEARTLAGGLEDAVLAARIDAEIGWLLTQVADYEAAHTLLVRSKKWSTLRVWGLAVAKRRGMARAKVAVARKLAVILHRMWLDDTSFRWSTEVARS